MLWQQNARREDAFVGNAAYGWFRPARLAQTPSESYALGPFSVQHAGAGRMGQDYGAPGASGFPIVPVAAGALALGALILIFAR